MSTCPVDNFTDAYPLLRRPFTPAAMKFKVQATWSNGALIVAYIDARLASGRLNHVIPGKWSTEFERDMAGFLQCHLTVDGITRSDIGEAYVGKGLYSDALKRAAVHFGVGESLYVLPQMRLSEGNLLKGRMVKQKNGQEKKVMTLTPAGMEHCRGVYTTWLDTVGIQAFGEPLDHGDVLYEEEPTAEPTTEPDALEVLNAAALEADVKGKDHAAIKNYIFDKEGEPIESRIKEVTEAILGDELGEFLVTIEMDAVPA